MKNQGISILKSIEAIVLVKTAMNIFRNVNDVPIIYETKKAAAHHPTSAIINLAIPCDHDFKCHYLE